MAEEIGRLGAFGWWPRGWRRKWGGATASWDLGGNGYLAGAQPRKGNGATLQQEWWVPRSDGSRRSTRARSAAVV